MKVKELIDSLNEMDPDKEVMGYWFDWKSEVGVKKGEDVKKHLFEIGFCFEKSKVYLNLEKTKEVKELK
ncbi:hypothetical protein [uncultured Anaerococcus sp.]|uniref:hypothetical protein n=1 Tax=uncultured Anaerococcus sp. TaxID=293428 RepID=UPI00280B6A9C|nr:hypothetical protein [uncultured Anaerococcus sp.]